MKVPRAWRMRLEEALGAPWFSELSEFVARERARGPVFPPAKDVFTALERTAPERVRVVILGQDPYHGEGQAHGLAFSVRPGVARPPSLQNIHRELESDLGIPVPSHGSLERWAEQDVLLLNSVLTVREGMPGSHAKKGWELFTDAVISAIDHPVVFVLWGSHAQKKGKLIDVPHRVLRAVHPSPLSAHRGFFGSRPFSTINAWLAEMGRPTVDWRL